MLKIFAMANPSSVLKVAIAQMSSSSDLDKNLEAMKRLIAEGVEKGAKVVAFGEMAYFTGSSLENRRVAERFDELCSLFATWAKAHGVYLLPGSLRSVSRGGKSFNRAVAFDPAGNRIGDYRKIFLFKANLPERRYDESEMTDPGAEIGTFSVDGLTAGFAICFDLRFPELFRALRKRGASLIFVPSAFTVPTGAAHWQALLRARAIENQCFLIGPALTGTSGDGNGKFGHSLVIDPWGETLLDLGEKEGLGVAEVRPDRIAEVQKIVDSLASQRNDLFPIA